MKSISIKRQNFGRKGSQATVIITSMLALLGVASIFWTPKTFYTALILIAFFYATKKHLFKYSLYKNTTIAVTISIIYTVLTNHFWQIPILETLFTATLLSFVFIAKKAWKESKTESEFEIFMMNDQDLKCLVTNTNDYKGYALNPTGYIKWYKTKDIDSLHFSEKYLTINAYKNTIHPRELNKEDLKTIQEFCTLNFPNLLKE